MRILVCGDRNWSHEQIIFISMLEVLSPYCSLHREIVLIEGEAPGADSLSVKAFERVKKLFTIESLIKELYADAEMNLPNFNIIRVPAKWNDVTGKPPHQICKTSSGRLFWKAAGPARNQEMLTHKPNIVLAFHDNIGKKNCGTLDMICHANKAGVEVRLYTSGKKEE